MDHKAGFRLPTRNKNKFPIPTGGPPQMKITGEPMPFIVTCCGCNKPSHVPDFDAKDPPKGFKCCYCGLKHDMKFNKNVHKWEIKPIREGEKSVPTTGDADRPTN